MYNGIGLATVRGSATSGHISKNLSYIKPDFFRNKIDANTNTSALGGNRGGNNDERNRKHGMLFKSNKDVIEHNKKHALEAEIYELRETMLENGFSEDIIERKVTELRNKQRSSNNYQLTVRHSGRNTDTHEISALKEEENKKLKNAFGIRDDFVSGAAFDPEHQAAQRQLREQQRANRNEQYVLDKAKRDSAYRDREENAVRDNTKANRVDEDRRNEYRGRDRYDSRDRRRYRDSRSRSRDRRYSRRSSSRDKYSHRNYTDSKRNKEEEVLPKRSLNDEDNSKLNQKKDIDNQHITSADEKRSRSVSSSSSSADDDRSRSASSSSSSSRSRSRSTHS